MVRYRAFLEIANLAHTLGLLHAICLLTLSLPEVEEAAVGQFPVRPDIFVLIIQISMSDMYAATYN